MAENELDKAGRAAADRPSARRAVSTGSDKPSPLMWLGLGSLAVVALLVVFVLPSLVAEYELPLERRAEVVSIAPPASSEDAGTGVSPFEEAQRAMRRKEAQDALAELLDAQDQLEDLQVEGWGQERYQAALEEASIGDDHYRRQDFGLAAQAYIRGRDSLTGLLHSLPEVLQEVLAEGQNALQEADTGLALERFSLALVLDPDNESAQIGLARAQVRDQVARLMQQAEDRFEDGALAEARDLYRQILELDGYHETVPASLAAVNALLLEKEFARVMSRGYALLQADDPEQAIAAFRRAAGLGINQAEAQAAILQTETEVANAQINGLRKQIEEAERLEKWAEAVAAYDAVLAIDPNLSFASTGRVDASQRANLDAFLEHAINAPERLAEQEVFEQTRGYYATAREIANPGTRLASQLDELERLLLYSQTPLEVQLRSDNLTDVTLLRVARLGLFEQQLLSLKPGRYVITGKRPGFRDVREEFTVGFGQTPAEVVVQCVEQVIASSGR